MSKGTHKTKDGRTAKKGLYYYMNRAKKSGTSKSGKGTVTDKALKDSAKTAKKQMGGAKTPPTKPSGPMGPGSKGVKPALEKLVDTRQKNLKKKATTPKLDKKRKGGFPDNNKDGKITQADIYLQKKKTGTIKKKGGVKKKMYGGKKKMMGGGMKKMMYKSGGFLEPKIPNLDDL